MGTVGHAYSDGLLRVVMMIVESGIGYLRWLMSCLFPWLKFRRARGGPHRPAFMGNCLTICHKCQPYLPKCVLLAVCVNQKKWDAGRAYNTLM